MKFFLTPLALAAYVLAQGISIANPPNGASLEAGIPVDVELDFPNSLTGVQHVSVVLSWISCAQQPCDMNATSLLGTVLYSGNYTPVADMTNPAKQPNQNITVTFPAEANQGSSLLNVAHFYLLGAASAPILEFRNITFNLAAPSQAAPQKRACNSRFCL